MDNWIRATKSNPCPVCGKPDWCLLSADGAVAICPRVENGHPVGNAGYLHRLNDIITDAQVRKIRLPSKVAIDMTALNNEYISQRDNTPDFFGEEWAFKQIGCGWDGNNFTFPMTDEHGTCFGIKKRTPEGKKFCESGSSLGLYYHEQPRQDLLLLPEGESDTVAAIMLGYFAVGRPSCNSCRNMISNFIRYTQVDTAVIVADNDRAGTEGAEKVRSACGGNVKIITPPAKYKDLRQWVEAGATRQVIDYMIGIAK